MKAPVCQSERPCTVMLTLSGAAASRGSSTMAVAAVGIEMFHVNFRGPRFAGDGAGGCGDGGGNWRWGRSAGDLQLHHESLGCPKVRVDKRVHIDRDAARLMACADRGHLTSCVLSRALPGGEAGAAALSWHTKVGKRDPVDDLAGPAPEQPPDRQRAGRRPPVQSTRGSRRLCTPALVRRLAHRIGPRAHQPTSPNRAARGRHAVDHQPHTKRPSNHDYMHESSLVGMSVSGDHQRRSAAPRPHRSSQPRLPPSTNGPTPNYTENSGALSVCILGDSGVTP